MIEHQGVERYPETLGDIRVLMEEWKESGISLYSVLYVAERVW